MLNSQKVSGMIVSITIDCPQQCWTMLLDVFSQMIFILKTNYFFHFHICLPGGDKLSTSAINFKWRLFSVQPYLTHFWYLLVISCGGFASYHTAVVGLDDIFNQLEPQPYRFITFSWNVDVNKPCQYVTCLILGAFITKIKGLFMSGCLEFQSGYPKFLDFRPQISVGLEMSQNLDEKKKRPHFLCLAPSLEGAGNGSQRFFWFCKECGLFIGLPFLFWTEWVSFFRRLVYAQLPKMEVKRIHPSHWTILVLKSMVLGYHPMLGNLQWRVVDIFPHEISRSRWHLGISCAEVTCGTKRRTQFLGHRSSLEIPSGELT